MTERKSDRFPGWAARGGLGFEPCDWRPRAEARTAAETVRSGRIEVEIADRFGNVVTNRVGTAYRCTAPEVYGLSRLSPDVREAGRIYGAICEELAAPGAPSTMGVLIQGGRWGGGNAVDRRLYMIGLRDRAWACLALQPRFEPQRRARAPKGEMTGHGKPHVARAARGDVTDPRQPIEARVVADLLCRDGMSFAQILVRHGWDDRSSAKTRIRLYAEGVLTALAEEWNGEHAPLARD